jgi:L-cysteine:1D-myo-inositol 2-amino-2-deoxy-alpha-D-glucopyranoside ligase
MYVCGITPYDATHLGHAFTYLTFDVIQRVWRDGGHSVHYVQNVTDIDDPLLERAVALGEDWREIARRETDLFRSDMETLGVIPPDDYIGAVESIPSIVRIIHDLQESDVVYSVDNDWYFDIEKARRFGEVSGYDTERMLSLFAERGGDPQRPGKRHPLDPLMWMAQRPDEPAWDTSLGHGRPGWHIECVAIALDHLDMGFDVQGGGSDLIFPHHEMSAAHASALTGSWPYARHYVHAGMVGYEGHKMSKSRGNLVFVSSLLGSGVDPSALRIALLSQHYRSDWEWTPAHLDEANRRLESWRDAVQAQVLLGIDHTIEQVRLRLADDLDTPGAFAIVDSWAREVKKHRGSRSGDSSIMARFLKSVLGIELNPK